MKFKGLAEMLKNDFTELQFVFTLKGHQYTIIFAKKEGGVIFKVISILESYLHRPMQEDKIVFTSSGIRTPDEVKSLLHSFFENKQNLL